MRQDDFVSIQSFVCNAEKIAVLLCLDRNREIIFMLEEIYSKSINNFF